jgi:hypothetical protein
MQLWISKRLHKNDHFNFVRMLGRLLVRWVEYGLQRMRATCTDPHSYAVLHLARFASGCTRHLRRCPATSFTCVNPNCYKWESPNWGSCTVGCGLGSQYRDNYCRDMIAGGGTVEDSFCLTYVGPEPATVQDCKPINCSAWQTDAGWDVCSVHCSSGTQNRGVWCQDTTLNQLAGSPVDCSPHPKPATLLGCGLPCTNNFLASFSVSNQVSFPFTPTQQVYTINVPSHITTSTSTAARQDPLATMMWNIQTVSGLVYPTTQPIQVTVHSEAGVDRVYTVNVYPCLRRMHSSVR